MQTDKAIRLNFSKTRKLVHASFEAALWGAGAFHKNNEDRKVRWTSSALQVGLFIDLSLVRRCDLGAAARLVLFVERALRDGLRVTVALPNPELRRSEREWQERYLKQAQHQKANEIEHHRSQREGAANFLKAIDFAEALQCRHLPEVREGQLELLAAFDPNEESPEEQEEQSMESQSAQASLSNRPVWDKPVFEHMVPLRWLDTDPQCSESVLRQLEGLKDDLRRFLSSQGRGIPDFDANAITHVIFDELRENVAEHSGCSHFLLGVWTRAGWDRVRPEDFLKEERAYFEDWSNPNDFPVIDIALGDSGHGIHHVLKDAYLAEPEPREAVPRECSGILAPATLFWSMARWSSSKDAGRLRRGTRGLHRIRRMVQAYHGQFSLRAGNALAGWNYGGADLTSPFQCTGEISVPGTYVSIQLAVCEQEKTPKSPDVTESDIEFFFAQPLHVTRGGLADDQTKKLAEALSTQDPRNRRCVIAVVGSLPPRQRGESKLGLELESAFRDIRDIANPGALALILYGVPPKELAIYIDSFNHETEREFGTSIENGIRVTNPILVIDVEGGTHWAGIAPWQEALIRTAEKDQKGKIALDAMAKVIPNPAHLEQTIRDFRQHQDLFHFHEDGAISIRFLAGNVLQEIESATEQRLLDVVFGDPRPTTTTGVERNFQSYLSPTLQVASRWLDTQKAVGEFGLFQVTPTTIEKALKVPALANVATKIARNQFSQFNTCAEIRNLVDSRNLTVDDAAFRDLLDSLMVAFGAPFLIHALIGKIVERLEGQPVDHLFYNEEEHEGIARGLCRLLNINESPIRLPPASELQDAESVWDIIKDRNVVLFFSSLLSGNSAAQVIGQTLRSGGNPLVVATMFDFRIDPDSRVDQDLQGATEGERRIPLWFTESDRRIPLVALAWDQNFVLKDTLPEHAERHIDSISRRPIRPENDGQSVPEHLISWSALRAFASEAQALCFNHHILPHNRHFTFYLDQKRLFEHSLSCRQLTCEAFSRLVIEHHIDAGNCLLAVIHDDLPTSIVEDVSRVLGAGKAVPVIEAQSTADGFRFRISDECSDRDLVLFTWNAQVGHTVSRLAIQAAKAGARRVFAVVCLSRMSPEQEEVLTSISEVAVPQRTTKLAGAPLPIHSIFDPPARTETLEIRTVPVRFQFLAHADIKAYGAHECPVCRQRDRISEELENYPAGHLRQYAETYVNSSRPRDHHQILHGELDLRDPYGTHIDSAVVAEMFEFHSHLNLARRNTGARLKVFRQLEGLVARVENGDGSGNTWIQAEAVCALLATEIHWFKLPPLVFAESRGVLSRLASLVLKNPAFRGHRHAIVVLRASDKMEFADKAGEIAARFWEHPPLLQQLVYDCFTYVNQKHHHSKGFLDKIVLGLDAIGTTTGDLAMTVGTAEIQRIHSAVTAVAALAKQVRSRIEQAPEPGTAWKTLRDFYEEELRNSHRDLPSLDLMMHLGFLEQGPGPVSDVDDWRHIRAKWRKTSPVLRRTVFPQVQAIQKVLECRYYKRRIGEADLVMLMAFSAPYSDELRVLGDLLDQFSEAAPHTGSIEWKKFVRLRNDLGRLFLKCPDKSKQGGALIDEVLRDCPCNPLHAVASALNDPRWTSKGDLTWDSPRDEFGKDGISNLEVFCPHAVVDSVIAEALSNALIYHRKPDPSIKCKVRFSYSTTDERSGEPKRFHLKIENFGSDSSYRSTQTPGEGGWGLKEITAELKDFGATLVHGVSTTPGFDYQVDVIFPIE